MYESYWQLTTKPFDGCGDARFHYPCESQQGAMLKLRYALENRRGAAVLAGQSGLGKTALAQTLLRQLGDAFSPRVQVVFPQLPADQLLACLADQVTGEASGGQSTAMQNLRRLEQNLRENHAAGKHAVIVIDEGQLLAEMQSLETIRLLLNLEQDGRPLASFLLVGQTALMVAVDRLPELEERIAVKCLLRRFQIAETMGYIQHRLQAAGCQRAIFTDAALAKIHELTHGVARRINRLCDLTLLVGFAEERSEIGPEEVSAIADELSPAAAE